MMTIRYRYILLAVLAASLTIQLHASEAFGFARIYESNMVFQQNREIKVWGYAEAGSKVSIALVEDKTAIDRSREEYPPSIRYVEKENLTISKVEKAATADQKGVWSVTLPAMKASFQPISITVSGGQNQSDSIVNVLVGEVWVCSGQSNMAWAGTEQSDLFQNTLQLHGIRYTRYDYTWPRPLADLPSKIEWNELSQKSFGGFSKVPYFFARALHLNLGVPVGVIINARGGTLGMSWTSWEELESIDSPEVKKIVTEYQADLKDWESPDSLQRLAKAKDEIEKIWKPKAQKMIDAHWEKYDTFIKENLDDEKYADWKKRFSTWQKAINEPKNSPGVLHSWKVWGLERQCKEFFVGTDLKPPEMDMSFWKERPIDKDPRLGWSPPAGLFNAGAAPLKSLAIAGMIYYQGENQHFGPISALTRYETIFPKVISAHRKLFNRPDLPFGIISLAGWGNRNAPVEKSMYGRYPYIMEIHAKTHQNTPNTGLAVIHDLGDADIHPPNKRDVGERAARWALGAVYEKEIRYQPTFLYKSVEMNEGKVLLSFAGSEEKEAEVAVIYSEWKAKRRKAPRLNTVLPPTLDGGDYLGFTVAGEDRRWYPAQAKANMKERLLEVWSELVPHPVAVRYGWEQFSEGNLGSKFAPHPVFRTDDWPCPEPEGKDKKAAPAEALLDREIRTHAAELIKRLGEDDQDLIDELRKLSTSLDKE